MNRFPFRVLASAIALASILAPVAGHANAAGAECFGTTDADGIGSCALTFHADGPHSVSYLRTHANFHTLGAMGELRMEWIDAAGEPVATIDCVGLGTMGATDLLSVPLCTRDYHKDTYVVGDQTLTVTAVGDADALFHGRVEFSGQDDLI